MSRDDLPETPSRRTALKGALAAGALLTVPGVAQAHAVCSRWARTRTVT
ncbi:twin-arginine translocation signal domain-containing protein [Streptomyces sp. NPDC048484]